MKSKYYKIDNNSMLTEKSNEVVLKGERNCKMENAMNKPSFCAMCELVPFNEVIIWVLVHRMSE